MSGLTARAMEAFIARDYQVELFQMAQKENIIVYMPTGSGKTFIAAMAIRERAMEVAQPLSSGGRRTVFLVPTVLLVTQQAEFLRRHTHLKVGLYYGEMGTDLWKEDRWSDEFERNHVLVMTPQIFAIILNHRFFHLSHVNLLVLDECHRAVGDDPMKMVLNQLKLLGPSERQPRVLGLTAALFRKRIKPRQVLFKIQDLCSAMKSAIKMPTQMESVLRCSTKPCEVLCQYEDETKEVDIYQKKREISLSLALSYHIDELKKRTSDELRSPEFEPLASIWSDTLSKLEYLLANFGPLGFYHGSLVSSLVMDQAAAKMVRYRTQLGGLKAHLSEMQSVCDDTFGRCSLAERLRLYMTPRVLRLLEILRQFRPPSADAPAKDAFTAIVFVERRCSASVLFHLLKLVTQCDAQLDFIRPLFTMGQAAGRGRAECPTFNVKQADVMKQFRDGRCNLLVATSVLEEGIDVPACNVIVRFDPAKTYCDYVQTKGRARSAKAYYFLLVSRRDTSDYLTMMAEFHAIEKCLLEGRDFGKDEREGRDDVEELTPYCPYGDAGPRIISQAAIGLVHRYCSTLTSDGTPLLPVWSEETMPSSVPAISPGNQPFQMLFRYRLQLPINCPLRGETIVSRDWWPLKRSAKRATALEACKKLHELGELDPIHLLPVRTCLPPEPDLLDEQVDDDGPQPGTKKRVQVYERAVASALRQCHPVAGQPCFVYTFEYDVVSGPTDGSIAYRPDLLANRMALLGTKPLAPICTFPIITRYGEFQVRLAARDRLVLDADQLERLRAFHSFLVRDVILVFKKEPLMDFDQVEGQQRADYLTAPLIRSEGSDQLDVDWNLVDRVLGAPTVVDWQAPPVEPRPAHGDYVDGVVTPWYATNNNTSCFYVDAVTELTPLSAFPGAGFANYADFFRSKYNIRLADLNQPLLQLGREIRGRNFLLRRQVTRSTELTTIHLPVELVHLHPLPASLWRQVVWLPCVLHRINHLLLADQVRRDVVAGAGIGRLELDAGQAWPSLLQNTKQPESPTAASEPDDQRADDEGNGGQDDDDSVDLSVDLWLLDLSTDYRDGIVEPPKTTPSLRGEKVPKPPQSASLEPEARHWKRRFDVDVAADSPGPGPGLILEALTAARTAEGFDLERLETIGDSLLKLAVSVYVYGQSAAGSARAADEGLLSLMRSRQISNRNLYRLGRHLELATVMAAKPFDLKTNYVASCSRPASADETSQTIADKNVADGVEALIGAYLVASGVAGAVRFLQWLGLNIVPDRVDARNPHNLLPLLGSVRNAVDDHGPLLEQLCVGLDDLERKLDYTFADKTLLVEALSHPSYFPNRLTDSYQRLEFLGDAVLDYLVTRFYFDDDRRYSPADLTDLRSATVCNATFAVLAVRHGLHRHLRHMSSTLGQILDHFISLQEANGHAILNEYYLVAGEAGEEAASDVEVPKVLGDVFESVAGAVWVDSGMSLDAVWRVFYPLMHVEMRQYSRRVPKSALRLLYEAYPGQIRFREEEAPSDGRMAVSLDIGGRRFRGVGPNKRTAKCAAAKFALRFQPPTDKTTDADVE